MELFPSPETQHVSANLDNDTKPSGSTNFSKLAYEEFLDAKCNPTCDFCQALRDERVLDESKRDSFCKTHQKIYETHLLNINIIAMGTGNVKYEADWEKEWGKFIEDQFFCSVLCTDCNMTAGSCNCSKKIWIDEQKYLAGDKSIEPPFTCFICGIKIFRRLRCKMDGKFEDICGVCHR